MNDAIKTLKKSNKKKAFAILRGHIVANPKDANAKQVLAFTSHYPHANAIRKPLNGLVFPQSPPDQIRQISRLPLQKIQ